MTGEMAERSIALVLKTSDGQPSVGSNPTLSASAIQSLSSHPAIPAMLMRDIAMMAAIFILTLLAMTANAPSAVMMAAWTIGTTGTSK